MDFQGEKSVSYELICKLAENKSALLMICNESTFGTFRKRMLEKYFKRGERSEEAEGEMQERERNNEKKQLN